MAKAPEMTVTIRPEVRDIRSWTMIKSICCRLKSDVHYVDSVIRSSSAIDRDRDHVSVTEDDEIVRSEGEVERGREAGNEGVSVTCRRRKYVCDLLNMDIVLK